MNVYSFHSNSICIFCVFISLNVCLLIDQINMFKPNGSCWVVYFQDGLQFVKQNIALHSFCWSLWVI